MATKVSVSNQKSSRVPAAAGSRGDNGNKEQALLLEEIRRLRDLYDSGDMSVTIPVEPFSGLTREMVELINDAMSIYSDALLKKAEEAKKYANEAEKQKQFAYTMVMQNPQPQLIVNKEMAIKLANEAFVKMSGIPPGAVTTMNLKSFKVLEKSGHNVREALDTLKGVSGYVTVEFPSGVRYLEQHSIPMLDKQGQLVSLMTVYNDLTEKKKSEVAERELSEYTSTYVSTLSNNLSLLAQGNMAFDLNLAEANENTRNAREGFEIINKSLVTVRDNLLLLVRDTELLAKAAQEGRLSTRAKAADHHGEYRKIIEGFNMTLDQIVEPVHEGIRVSGEYAGTNFTAHFDEKQILTGDFLRFKDSLNSIGFRVSEAVTLVNKQVLDLAAAAEEANASIEEVASGANQVATSSASVSSNAEKGGMAMQQALRAMEDFSATVASVASKTEAVSQLTQEANTMSKKGSELARKTEMGMSTITRNASDVDTIVRDIKSQMDQIGKIVNVITDLANQTNLLALNAAIEAARAGDAGRGFAVVATEVKSLAQESRESAENIAEMIGNLQKKSQAAADAAAEAGKTVKEGSSALGETLETFNKIVASVDDISRNIEMVAASAQEQAATVEEVTASLHEVNNLIQNTAKEAVDSAAASEEASAAIDQIGKIIENVNTIVDSVSREMSKFKV
jgi:methyl-accepting chemotaxis protein